MFGGKYKILKTLDENRNLFTNQKSNNQIKLQKFETKNLYIRKSQKKKKIIYLKLNQKKVEMK